MALGTFSRSDKTGQVPAAPTFVDRVSFLGDGSYPTGGTAGFAAKLQALAKDGRAPIAVIGQDCGGYVPVYDEANDKLKVYKSAGSAIALAEVANAADLSGTTFNVIVISQ